MDPTLNIPSISGSESEALVVGVLLENVVEIAPKSSIAFVFSAAGKPIWCSSGHEEEYRQLTFILTESFQKLLEVDPSYDMRNLLVGSHDTLKSIVLCDSEDPRWHCVGLTTVWMDPKIRSTINSKLNGYLNQLRTYSPLAAGWMMDNGDLIGLAQAPKAIHTLDSTTIPFELFVRSKLALIAQIECAVGSQLPQYLGLEACIERSQTLNELCRLAKIIHFCFIFQDPKGNGVCANQVLSSNFDILYDSETAKARVWELYDRSKRFSESPKYNFKSGYLIHGPDEHVVTLSGEGWLLQACISSKDMPSVTALQMSRSLSEAILKDIDWLFCKLL